MTIDPRMLEALMLLCFGSSWPFAVSKTLKTRSVEGKSLIFLCLIMAGYVSGIIYKITTNLDHVIWIYFLNGSMVFTEILLYFIYQTPKNRSANCLLKIGDVLLRQVSPRKPDAPDFFV
jgi:hypothetical protein